MRITQNIVEVCSCAGMDISSIAFYASVYIYIYISVMVTKLKQYLEVVVISAGLQEQQ